MRSVVVVLPASICAIIPMFRVLASSALLAMIPSSFLVLAGWCLLGFFRAWPALRSLVAWPARQIFELGRRTDVGVLPAVVREGLVGLRHLVGVLAPLDAGAEAVAGVEELVHQALGHRLLPALP